MARQNRFALIKITTDNGIVTLGTKFITADDAKDRAEYDWKNRYNNAKQYIILALHEENLLGAGGGVAEVPPPSDLVWK